MISDTIDGGLVLTTARGSLPDGPADRRATAAMLRAPPPLGRRPGGRFGAAKRELGALLSDGQTALTWFAMPLVTAGEWLLAVGDAREWADA